MHIEEPNHNHSHSLAEVDMRAASRIKAKIVHVLSIYPKLMPSMLQIGVGPSISPELWRPVLEVLIREGVVDRTEIRSTTPTGRYGTSTILSLTPLGLEHAAAQASQDKPANDAQSNGASAHPRADDEPAVVSREVGLG